LFLKEELDAVGSAVAEVAAVAVLPGVTSGVAPGAELRERFEITGSAVLNKLSFAVFASPTTEPVLTRFGLGLELNYALTDDRGDDPDFLEGEHWIVPFLLVGASL
jgi:hypothetical protein